MRRRRRIGRHVRTGLSVRGRRGAVLSSVRAPELRGRGGWLNTDSALTLADLRGRIVLLDFWTSCCANCLHVLDELRPLEKKYEDVLVVIGVHSPKFEHEREHAVVAAAVERYEVEHPVLDDPDLYLWQQYAVKAWPTLVVIDPQGYVVAQAAGEGQVSALDRMIAELIIEHESRGTLRRGDGPYVAPALRTDDLRFPAKAIRSGDGLLVADAGHHQIVELDLDGRTVRRRFGAGRGQPFAEPNGLTQLPDGSVLVADTANHVLRFLDGDRAVRLDRGLRTITGEVPGGLSPWDVAWWPALGQVVIAAAGVHLLLAWDPGTDEVRILAGTTVEGLKDGPALDGWLAQPSGLAVDGDRLWFVDAETSALRWLSLDGILHTAVGEGLFDFGLVDGAADRARLQHPLGVTMLPDGAVAVLDTYNGAVRRWADGQLTTMAAGLNEPSGAVVVDGDLVVVESGAHRLVRPVPTTVVAVGSAMRTSRPIATVGTGPVVLAVVFTPPTGRALDDRYGPATRLSVEASPAGLLLAGAGSSASLRRDLVLAEGTGVLNVVAQAASCDVEGDHPACHLARQDWGVPIHAVPGGPDHLELVLLG